MTVLILNKLNFWKKAVLRNVKLTSFESLVSMLDILTKQENYRFFYFQFIDFFFQKCHFKAENFSIFIVKLTITQKFYFVYFIKKKFVPFNTNLLKFFFGHFFQAKYCWFNIFPFRIPATTIFNFQLTTHKVHYIWITKIRLQFIEMEQWMNTIRFFIRIWKKIKIQYDKRSKVIILRLIKLEFRILILNS